MDQEKEEIVDVADESREILAKNLLMQRNSLTNFYLPV